MNLHLEDNKKDSIVSIIVPAHNAESSIKRCIDSLVNQTYHNIEIIVIENNSKDKTFELCKNYKDTRIKLVRTSSEGVSNARNLGLTISTGDYVTFCDADDYYTPNHVELVLNAFDTTDVDIVISGYYLCNGTTCGTICKENSKYIARSELIHDIFIGNECGGFCWNKAFKRAVLDNCWFPEKLSHCEDTYFLFETLEKSKSIYYLAKPLSYYVLNSQSATNNWEKIISKDHNLQFSISYKSILHDFSLDSKTKNIVYLLIFETSVVYGWKYYKSHGKDTIFKKNLHRDETKYLSVYLKSHLIPWTKKVKRLLQFFFMTF